MSTSLNRLAELAHADPTQQFLSLAHLLTPEALLEAFSHLRKDASAGVDDVTHAEYAEHAEENIRQLHERLRNRRYRAQPLRRVYIPKEPGKERPISIPTPASYCTSYNTASGFSCGLRILEESRTQVRMASFVSSSRVIQYGEPLLRRRALSTPRSIQ